ADRDQARDAVARRTLRHAAVFPPVLIAFGEPQVAFAFDLQPRLAIRLRFVPVHDLAEDHRVDQVPAADVDVDPFYVDAVAARGVTLEPSFQKIAHVTLLSLKSESFSSH